MAGDAAGLLLECHGRIRSFLALAGRLAEPRGDELAAIGEAAERVFHYFDQALPLHARDEEESVLPRLRGREPALDGALADMAREHGEHQPPLRQLTEACRRLAADPSRQTELAPVLAAAAAELQRHFAEHLTREESVILPAMRRLLGPAADAAVREEMRQRRGPAEKP